MDGVSDPLALLPPEVVLRVLLFLEYPDLLKLEATSKGWSAFINQHESYLWYRIAQSIERDSCDVIQQRNGRMTFEEGDLDKLLKSKWSLEQETWKGVSTWREYCKRKTSIMCNLSSGQPKVSSRLIRGDQSERVWRLRPDFETRMIIYTRETGGLHVVGMDDGIVHWSLDEEAVGAYAHLEHDRGTLAFNAEYGNTIDIWRRADLVSGAWARRAEYVKVGRLPHPLNIRGWHLRGSSLCVVSNQGKGWVYDVSATPPVLSQTIDIRSGARGHLEQDDTMVMYSMKSNGYDFHYKADGKYYGTICPADCDLDERNFFGLSLLPRPVDRKATGQAALHPLEKTIDIDENTEWGVGMVCGKHMIGVSREAEVMVVSDWPRVAKDPSYARECTSIICTGGYLLPESFDLGGWLTIGGTSDQPRVCFEADEYVYMMPLPGVGELCCADGRQSPTHAISTSHDPQLNVPVSFMQMGEDHLLMTYYNATARRNHAQFLAAIQEHLNTAGIDPFRLAAVNTVPGSGKCPRLISFAPWLDHQS